jgi:hypothetical protein
MVEVVLVTWIIALGAILLLRRDILISTWREPYMGSPVVILESDDWGPGPTSHADALASLVRVLSEHRDSVGRPAVLTANIVLTIPNARVIKESKFGQYTRIPFDEVSPEIMAVLKKFIAEGKIVPQLHGLEHYNLNTLLELARKGDERIQSVLTEEGWTSWEILEPHLQRHYLDSNGSPPEETLESHNELVTESTKLFRRLFDHDSLSTMAPCSFWTDETEEAWKSLGIRYIQTEGYRLVGRYKEKQFRQDPKVIRFGSRNRIGQMFLARNVMYEPVLGKSLNASWKDVVRAFRQALPVIISTHRNNFTDDQITEEAFQGLGVLMSRIEENRPRIRYLSSPELGEYLENGIMYNRFFENEHSQLPDIKRCTLTEKIEAYIFRIWYRHNKIRLIAFFTGLIIPILIVIGITRLIIKLKS